MRRWSFLILCLIAASFTTSAAIHAREISGSPALECSGYVHSDGDSDQSQGDADQAAPHHHGSCHGAASLIPPKPDTPLSVDRRVEGRRAANPAALGRWTTGPDLRPPIA